MNGNVETRKIRHVAVERDTQGGRADEVGDYCGWSSRVRVVIATHTNFPGVCVGGWGAQDRDRIVTGGPLVSGPRAFAANIGGMISEDGGTLADMRREREAGLLIEAEPGDLLEMFGELFEIGFIAGRGREFVELTHVGQATAEVSPR